MAILPAPNLGRYILLDQRPHWPPDPGFNSNKDLSSDQRLNSVPELLAFQFGQRRPDWQETQEVQLLIIDEDPLINTRPHKPEDQRINISQGVKHIHIQQRYAQKLAPKPVSSQILMPRSQRWGQVTTARAIWQEQSQAILLLQAPDILAQLKHKKKTLRQTLWRWRGI